LLAGLIDAGEGFIKQKIDRVLCQRPRKKYALLLTSRQRSDRFFRFVGQADVLETVCRPSAFLWAGPANSSEPGIGAKQHGIQHRNRKVPVDIGSLRNIGDVGSQALERTSVKPDGPRISRY